MLATGPGRILGQVQVRPEKLMLSQVVFYACARAEQPADRAGF